MQALAVAAAGHKVGRMCQCLPPGHLALWYDRLAAAHAAAGFTLMPGWLPADSAAAGGGCAPVLAAVVANKALLVATLWPLALEAAARAWFLASLPPARAAAAASARRELAAGLAVSAAVGASLLPVVWEGASAAAKWAAPGGRPGWVKLLFDGDGGPVCDEDLAGRGPDGAGGQPAAVAAAEAAGARRRRPAAAAAAAGGGISGSSRAGGGGGLCRSGRHQRRRRLWQLPRPAARQAGRRPSAGLQIDSKRHRSEP
jgi:hypothetical protein